MAVIYANQTCEDAIGLMRSCLESTPQIPVKRWLRLANTYAVGLGPEPSTGLLLMTKENLDKIDVNSHYGHNLTFAYDKSITFKYTIVRRYQAVTPSYATAPDAVYKVWVTDKRWVLRRTGIDQAYNVRDGVGGDFLPETSSDGAGTAWTWNEMFQDIWGQCTGLGTAPSLPFTPDGEPEGFLFYGSTVFDALTNVLDRLACKLRYNPATDVFSVVRLGADDTTATSFLAQLEAAKIKLWDDYADLPGYARLPAYVRVLFVKTPIPDDGTSTFYKIDVTDATATGGESTIPLSGTVVNLEDDMPAIYANGTLTNLSDMTTRAAERAADWFRREKNFHQPLHRVYSGIEPNAMKIVGSQCLAVLFEDAGDGLKTEIIRGPDDFDTLYREGDSSILSTLLGGGPEGSGGESTLSNNPGNNSPYWYQQLYHYSPYLYQQLYQQGSGGGGRDWHYYRHIDTTRRHFSPWPVEYATTDNTTYSELIGDEQLAVLCLVPYLEARGGVLDRIGIFIPQSMAGPVGETVRLGIYESLSDTNLIPGNLVLDAGEIGISTEGLREITISKALSAKFYWLAVYFTECKGSPFTAHILGHIQNPIWGPFGVSASTTTVTGDGVLGADTEWLRGCIVTWADPATPPATFPNPFLSLFGGSGITYDTFDRESTPRLFTRYSS